MIHRLQFAFTVTFHYLFPQLTMGLAPLIVVLKTLAIKKNDDTYNQAARFWAKIFGINFAIGVVTGIPMEFQFGTNWSHFSRFAGGVIGQTLAMEGVFSFFLESTFLGLFLYGEKRLSRGMHWFAAFMVFVGSWASGFFIIATDAWMQNPVGYEKAAERLRATQQLLGADAESVGLGAVCAQHERRGHHGRICHGCCRCLLPAGEPPRRPGAYLPSRRSDRRSHRHRNSALPDRRPRGQDGCA